MNGVEGTLAGYFGTDLIEAAGRLGFALLLGMILGIDREFYRKPAGLRSHMLVALASASFTIITFEIVEFAARAGDAIRLDPIRLMQAVVAGVAFLGAGAIIHGSGTVKGITTGASLWLAGALGVACGIGHYAFALLTALLGFAVLFLLGWLEWRLAPDRNRARDASGN